ncbi:MAG: hypothetical protein BWY91_03312 [bacterium ADurb.BinA028]|nr:MAG: hypothetical protein BWY91_03312 [bacterium ADurb.BinA028]
MTNSAMTWPSRVPWMREKVTKARLAALSINSMPMKMMIALRRTRTVAAPIVKSRIDR